MTSTLRSWFRSAADVRRDEYGSVALMFGYGFLALTSYYLIKPARNSIFVDRVGAEHLPWVYILTALVVLAVMVLYSKYVDRVGRITLILSSIGGLASLLVLFWWFLQGESGVIASGGFYVFTKLYPLFLVSQFWLVANLLFNTTQARRLFGLIGVGLILGGIAGSSIASVAADRIGTERLLLLATGVLAVCAILVLILSPRIRAEAGDASGRLTDEISGSAIKLLRDSSHLKTIAVILTLTIVVGTLLDWQLNRAVEIFIEGEDAKTQFFGRFYATLNVVSVVVQVLFTGYVLRRFGVSLALFVLPVVLGLAGVAILAFPLLYVVTVGKGAEGALRYSLDQSTRELLFLPVPTDVKYKVKPLIDLAIYRGGTGLGGVLLLIFVNGLNLSLRWISVLTVLAVGGWLVAAWRMRKEFTRSLRRLIEVQDVRLEELLVQHLGAEVVEELRGVLRSGNEEEVLYALALLQRAPSEELSDDLMGLLAHESPEVRRRAVELLSALRAEKAEEEVRRLLHDESLAVRAEAIQYLCEVGAGDPAATMEAFLEDEESEVQVGAVGCLMRHGNDRQRTRGLQRVKDMAREEDVGRRRTAAALLGQMKPLPPEAVELLEGLIQDPDVATCHHAMQAVGSAKERSLLPLILERFQEPAYRPAAVKALQAFGAEAHGQILDVLEDPEASADTKGQIPPLLLPDAGQPSVQRLWESLPSLDPTIRYPGLKTLNKLRRDRDDLSFQGFEPRELVHLELTVAARHLLAHKDLQGARNWAGHGDREPALLDSLLLQRFEEAAERAVRALALRLPQDDLYAAFSALTSSRAVNRQRGFELLDALLPQGYRTWFDPLLNPDSDPDHRADAVAQIFGVERLEAEAALDRLVTEGDLWVSTLAHMSQGRTGIPESHSSETLKEQVRLNAPLGCDLIIPTHEDEFMDMLKRGEVLRRAKIFESLRTEDLAAVAALTEERAFKKGQVIFEERDPGKALFVVVEGRIQATKGGRTLFEAVPGRSVGSLSLLDGLPTDYRAEAMEDTVTLHLEREPFKRFLQERGRAVISVLEYLTGVVRGLNEAPDREDRTPGW